MVSHHQHSADTQDDPRVVSILTGRDLPPVDLIDLRIRQLQFERDQRNDWLVAAVEIFCLVLIIGTSLYFSWQLMVRG